MFGLLTWLAGEADSEAALQRLLEAVPLAKRETLRLKLQSSIDIYSLEKEQSEGDCFKVATQITIYY
jgi:hypothetical protein